MPDYDLVDGVKHIRRPRECHSFPARRRTMQTRWKNGGRGVLKIGSSNEKFYRCYNQGVEDMAALRLPLKGTDHMVFLPAAGLPWFVALFGRDTLIRLVANDDRFIRNSPPGRLEVLGRLQATERDDYRDAELAKSCTSCGTASWRIQ